MMFRRKKLTLGARPAYFSITILRNINQLTKIGVLALIVLLTSTISYSILFAHLNHSHLSWRNGLLQLLFLNDGRDAIYLLPPAQTACRIFTYFQFLPSMAKEKIQPTLELWGLAFYARGFWPVILNRTSAEAWPHFNRTRLEFSIFPTVNPADYELSCYLRWVALASQGGGLFTDYDLLPLTSPKSMPIRELRACRWQQLTMYQTQAPMVTHGSAAEIERWIEYMRNFTIKGITSIQGRPHVSDMIMAQHSIDENENVFVLKPALPFFHYSYDARHMMFSHIKRNLTEIMNRNQHIYHFLHNDLYLPFPQSVSPYSVDIVRSLSLCPDIIEPYDDVDSLCAYSNNLTHLCALLTTKGYWSPTEPATKLCTWKMGHPNYFTSTEALESVAQEREPFLVAVLPHPSTYLWRLWLSENSLTTTNTSNRMHEFDSWVNQQPLSSMLDACIPLNREEIDTDTRITRIIQAMRSGSALVMTETLIAQLHTSAGSEDIENWISGHVGFSLPIPDANMSLWSEPVDRTNTRSLSTNERFYSAIERENERWTKDWNSWRTAISSSIFVEKSRE